MAQTEAELLDNPVAGQPTLILRSPDFHSITEAVAEPVERATPIGWWLFFVPSLALLGLLGMAISWLFWEGIGVWGLNVPVGWAWDITNFVFWVGIGHAGTLISAILFLFRQKWRTSINRAAEAMTIFAVMCAMTFPGIHVGRVWVAYFMFPIPNQMGVWPNFRSPLLWDVFAVSVYGTVSVLFWYVGLLPDLAMMRDRAKTNIRRFAYGFFALGWRGSVRQWHHYEIAYLVLAALATPLVLSVHSVVSMDFAVSVIPGWHTTIFPPYFVAGAIFSGFAMVLTLMVICRTAFRLEHIITLRHFDYMAKIMLVTGHDGRLRLCHGVLHLLVQRQPLRVLHVPEPRARTVRLGLLDHDLVQRDQPSDLLVQEGADEHPDPVRGLDRREHRHVVRAVRHHRDVAAP